MAGGTGGVSRDRPRPTQGLSISASGAAKIAERGYGIEDAQAVLDSGPAWIWQRGRGDYDENLGRPRIRPNRWRLVGRGFAGVVLAVVIELPGDDGQSQVVSIYEASPTDRSRYHEWARRRR